MKQKIFSLMLSGAAVMGLASCSSDDGPNVPADDEPVPQGYAQLKLNPVMHATGRAFTQSGVATTANLKDFDFIVTFPDDGPGAGTIKGRWDNTLKTVYSTDGGVAGSGKLLVPLNKKFVVTAMAAGHDKNGFVANGGMIDYLPSATGSVDLKAMDNGVVQDYIFAQSADMTATGDKITVPIEFNHMTSKVSISAEVASDQDFAVAMDPRVILTGEKSAWSVSNLDGTFASSGQDYARDFILKPHASSTLAGKDCFSDFRTTYGENLVYLTNKDGEVNLMWDEGDSPLSSPVWGSLENPRQLFWWPGQYAESPKPSWTGDTFNGGCSFIINFQAYHGAYNAAGQLVTDGVNFTRQQNVANLSTNQSLALGTYSVCVPIDLATNSRALAAGKAYKLKIKFFSGKGTQDYYSNVTVQPTVVDWETGDEYEIPN